MAAKIESIQFQGIDALQLRTPDGASAVISLYGAQVLSWIPAGGEEWLFLSERARFDLQSAVRGGIPVCFPQFSGLGDLPKHGFARTHTWRVASQQTDDAYAMVTLELGDDAQTRKLWPHAFKAEITLLIAEDRLDLELGVENTGAEPISFTAALHTYLRVREVEESVLEGLYGHKYRDAAKGDAIAKDSGPTLQVSEEVDRVYHDVERPLLLRDGKRSLGINADGFPDVVVWNPWEQGSAKLSDMAPAAFRHMLCVEAAAARSKVNVAPGDEWWGRQTLVSMQGA
ncbi:MAG TPA: D-hexose-6-phosphate mutarotase [Burkholderiales bacterium]